MELRTENDESTGRFVTYLVVTDAAGAPASVPVPLDVAWVWPITAAPALLPDATVDPAVVAQLRANGRLGRYVAEVAAADGFPLTVAPGPETMETWAELGRDNASLAQTLAVLQNTGGTNHQMLAGSYVPVDDPSLLRAKLSTALNDAAAEGARALQETFGVAVDPSTAVTRAVEPMSLSLIQARGVERLVVESDAIDDRSERDAPPATVHARGAAIRLPAGRTRACDRRGQRARARALDRRCTGVAPRNSSSPASP